jgi:hypothetical protein
MYKDNPDNFIACVLLLLAMFGFAACYESPTPEEEAQQKYRASQNCASKASGSSPRCWTEADWSAYCSRVRCK